MFSLRSLQMLSNRRYRAFHSSSMQIILISHPQAADSKSLMNVRDVFTTLFNDHNVLILERSYPTSTSSTARACTSTASLLPLCLLPFLRSLKFDDSVQALYVAPRQEPVSERVKRIKNPTRWTRFVLFICCVSVPGPDTNGHQ
jgi:hypothetical protein